jgi:aryl-phospho-beta-D-glucosidase BglC (GH1 family)
VAGRLVTAIAAVVLAACGDSATLPAPPSSEARQLLPLQADGVTIRDALGRQVLLRGLNHIGLRSNATRPAYRVDGVVSPSEILFDLQDVEDADFAFIASMGFSVLRPVFTWEFAQPDPPPAPYNEAYFALITAFLDRAAAHGLYVVFDFGQFGWGRGAGGNAGAPDWTLSETCLSLPPRFGNEPPQASARVGCAFVEFWQNEVVQGAGLQDHYIALWEEVMRRYRDHPAVVIADLFNEPYGGLIPPVLLEISYLYPFYRRLAAAIRAIDPQIVIGFQPELYHSLGIPTPAPEAIGIDNAVFLPHNYTAAYFTQRANPAYLPGQDLLTRADLATTAEDARTLGTPFAIGETGWTRTTTADGVGGPIDATDPTAPPKFGRDLTRLANELRIGWMWFAYSSTDQAYGLFPDGQLDEATVRAIATPFPRAVAGLETIAFDPDTRRLHLTMQPGPLPAEISVPVRWQYGEGACVEVEGGVPPMRFDPARAILTLDATPASLSITPLADPASCDAVL